MRNNVPEEGRVSDSPGKEVWKTWESRNTHERYLKE